MRDEQRSNGSPKKTGAAPPLGTYYTVGGRRLLLHRTGSGSPAVVLLAGAGAVGLDYLNVQRLAAELTTSVLYDRAGTGWSDGVRQPRTSTQVTDELRELLQAAGVPPPYILVGHSLGGLYARHYAQRFPDEVAALILLDPAHEDYNAYMPQHLNEMRKTQDPDQAASKRLTDSAKKQLHRLLSVALGGAVRSALARGLLIRIPTIQRYRRQYRELFKQEMTDWPEEIRDALIERHVSLEWLWAGLQEAQNPEQLYDEVSRAGPMPDVPLIVLCSTGIDGFRRVVSAGESESMLHEEIEGKRRLYDDLAKSVPRGENRLVDAGHFTMHFRHPDAVLRSIEDLLVRLAT